MGAFVWGKAEFDSNLGGIEDAVAVNIKISGTNSYVVSSGKILKAMAYRESPSSILKISGLEFALYYNENGYEFFANAGDIISGNTGYSMFVSGLLFDKKP